jgi:uncharacterized protein YndB with AHSA1/START domain
MKLLKWLLVAVVVLGIALVGGSLFLPATTHVERSATIDAPAPEVFATLNSFEHFNAWSPWAEMDPDAKYTFSGPASGVGARMTWAGNQAVGSGSQEILESVPHARIVNALDFGGNTATATYALVPDGAGTRITWSLDSEHGYNPINRWFGALALDGMIGRDYEKGLAKLKALVEGGKR